MGQTLIGAIMNMRTATLIPLLAVLMFGLPARAAQGADDGPTTAHWVELAGKRYRVELAVDDHARMRGLMFREHLDDDAGMLFVFEAEHPQAFWMKNTLIALDILYFDRHGKLVSVAADTPPCRTSYCPSYPSAGPARYVLELNAGHAARLGVLPGAKLRFGPGIPGAPLE